VKFFLLPVEKDSLLVRIELQLDPEQIKAARLMAQFYSYRNWRTAVAERAADCIEVELEFYQIAD
jgi:hypothetical protein